MASIFLWLPKSPDEKNMFRVYFRVTHHHQNVYIRHPSKIPADIVSRTKKGVKIKDKFIEHTLKTLELELQNKLFQYGLSVESMTAREIANRLTNKNFKDVFQLNIIEYWEKKIPTLKAQSTNNSALNVLKKYVGGSYLNIVDINKVWLNEYYAWLTQFYDLQATFNKMVGLFAKIYKMCQDEYNDEDEGGMIRIPNNPFDVVPKPQLRKVSKRQEQGVIALRPEVMKEILDMDESDLTPSELMAKDVFSLSFYMCGINLVDLAGTCTKIQIGNDTYIEYVRNKTKDKSPTKVRIKVEPAFAHLIERYAPTQNTGRVFSFMEGYLNYAQLRAAIGINLKKIALRLVKANSQRYNITKDEASRALGLDNFSFYVARRTWATIAHNQCRISEDTIDRCLGHVARSVSAIYYIRDDYSVVEEAKKKVIEYMTTVQYK